MTARKSSLSLERVLPWLLIVCGIIGLAAAAIIMVEKIHLLKDPSFVPSCDLNPVISCGSVMASSQSNAFGFPNPILGLIGFPIVIVTGVVLLQRLQLKRWYMLGLQAGTVFGLAFVHWLFFQSTYRIGALCPYCIMVWVVTITTFWYVLLYNIRLGHIRLRGIWQRIGIFLQKHHLDIVLVWFLGIAGLILHHFWYYYGPLLGL